MLKSRVLVMMKKVSWIIALSSLIAVHATYSGAADDGFPGVAKLMSQEEFRDSGLEKLSEAELKALNQWLIRYTAGDAEVLSESNEEVREAKKTYRVEARLGSEFDGWSGETIFKLDNGQVWQQRLTGRYYYRGPANPEVLIRKNWAGFYRLTLVKEGKSVGVTRLR